MKTSVKVLAVITCLSALLLITGGLTGCAADRNPQSTGRFEDLHAAERGDNRTAEHRMEDTRMAERIREALTAGVDYKYDGVKVLAAEGRVQLSGFVKTSAQRDNAREVASRIVGVTSVENNLAVEN